VECHIEKPTIELNVLFYLLFNDSVSIKDMIESGRINEKLEGT
jgi:hypothetical protein